MGADTLAPDITVSMIDSTKINSHRFYRVRRID